MNKVRVLIINGYGINCDVETDWAFKMAGADEIVTTHINRVINKEFSLSDFSILAFPGGFSFGDHIASGRILGVKIKSELGEELERFVEAGKLVIGICNGFQILVKMGLLPGKEGTVLNSQTCTLTHNDSAKYEDRWVKIKPNNKNISPFLKDIQTLPIAVRHGEGKFIAMPETMNQILEEDLIAFQYTDENNEPTQKYPENPNGTEKAIAGITNKRGNVLGMMPHPEVYIQKTQHPSWTREKDLPNEGSGLKIFTNAVDYVRNEL